ncbi:MAG TPA: hypothetical protein VL200_02425 [Lacunisphaera sp.]|jgi:tRNA threonylcarbamoyladenosine biosynthesis protein TsaB|nr:hypothetical protein [Lacunisphaera sp.]
MPSLTQLLAKHQRLLVLDAASRQFQAGLLRENHSSLWELTEADASTAIFTCVNALLQDAGLRVADLGAVVYCEGPGSMLGIRSVAMAIRTWGILAPLATYSYQSLAVAGLFAWRAGPARPLAVIADARRGTWHCQEVARDGTMPEMRRLGSEQLPPGELLMPEHFRSWDQPPRAAAACRYDLARILPALADCDCFRKSDHPNALQLEAPEYRRWTAQVHRAEARSP